MYRTVLSGTSLLQQKMILDVLLVWDTPGQLSLLYFERLINSMSTTLSLSIIIPIYNGADKLALTLQALANQDIDPTTFEVIMVDDGSTDNPAAVVSGLTLPFQHQFIRQQNAGLAVTRNRGAAKASAPASCSTASLRRICASCRDSTCSTATQKPR